EMNFGTRQLNHLVVHVVIDSLVEAPRRANCAWVGYIYELFFGRSQFIKVHDLASHSRIHYVATVTATQLTLLFSLLLWIASSGNTSLDDRCSPVTPLFRIATMKINQ
ncbi:hypothetical protein X777_10152, partial [Ooceraea biroi]